MEAIAGKQDASLAELFVVLAISSKSCGSGRAPLFLSLGCFDDDHESHCEISFGLSDGWAASFRVELFVG